MKSTIVIQGNSVHFDFEKTTKRYLNETNIIEDCTCEDCLYFVTTVIKLRFEIFQILKDVGVNLGKNLNCEPTGVWCIRDDNGEFICFQQAYLIIGNIVGNEENTFLYKKEELGFSVTAKFTSEKVDEIIIDLQIDKI